MRYGLGVDLGTTFTGAAIGRPGHTEMVTLGERTTVAPAVVFARSDGRLVSGDPAVRRALEQPDRAAREFKRRLGDPTPLILGGTPYSPARLMAATLSAAVDQATELFGVPPERIVLTHPAVWGPYRREQFDEVPRLAGLEGILTVAEPVAAATYYTATRDLSDGDIIAVYDLGGGTFDLTVVVAQDDAMRILGHPEGVEWLGGIDFDEAVVSHVDRALGGAVRALDLTDQRQAAALFRLRQECVLAKEALSVEEEVTIPAYLPNRRADVRLTRAEFEEMIQPALDSTIEAMVRGLDSAGVKPDDVTAVLLVGGSSRIPLVARMVKAAVHRPTVVNAHPKHSVALGAALLAGQALDDGPSRALASWARPAVIGAPAQPADPPAPATQAAPEAAPKVPPRPGPKAATEPKPTVRRRRRGRSLLALLLAVLVLVAAGAAGTLYGRAHRTEAARRSTSSGPAASGRLTLQATMATRGKRPQGVAFTPDGARAYVPDVVSDTVSVIATAQDREVEQIPVPAPPQYLVMSPDGGRLYVTLIDPKAKHNALAVIDTSTDEVVGSVGVDSSPNPPAISPDGRTLYVPDQDSSRIAVISTRTDKVTGHIAIPGVPSAVAFAPDGLRAYVTNFNLEQLSVLDVASGKTVSTVRVGVTPIAVAASPDGTLVAVANYDSRTISLVDVATQQAVRTVRIGYHPQAVAFAPDGRTLYAVNDGDDTLSVVSVPAGTVRQTIAVGKEPWAVAVSPNGRQVYVSDAGANDMTVLANSGNAA